MYIHTYIHTYWLKPFWLQPFWLEWQSISSGLHREWSLGKGPPEVLSAFLDPSSCCCMVIGDGKGQKEACSCSFPFLASSVRCQVQKGCGGGQFHKLVSPEGAECNLLRLGASDQMGPEQGCQGTHAKSVGRHVEGIGGRISEADAGAGDCRARHNVGKGFVKGADSTSESRHEGVGETSLERGGQTLLRGVTGEQLPGPVMVFNMAADDDDEEDDEEDVSRYFNV